MQGFGYDNSKMAFTLLKFINEMLAKSEGDEKRQAKFLAKLEGIGIKEILEKWHMSDNIDIHDQIQSYQYYSNNITGSVIYKLEVHKNRVRDLEAHRRVLEAKVEQYREQQAMFKVMMNDLELYKQKADMSKQLATYFSPFSPIKTFS